MEVPTRTTKTAADAAVLASTSLFDAVDTNNTPSAKAIMKIDVIMRC
jgi:hypothetical protein